MKFCKKKSRFQMKKLRRIRIKLNYWKHKSKN